MHMHGEAPGWPAHLRPGAVRFARTSRHYDETIRFYRDLVGLPVVGEFAASFGEDGTIFGLPDTRLQLEIVRAHGSSDVGRLDQLVLYLDDAAAVRTATGRLSAAGLSPAPDPHPYWAANGAVVHRDPDGREVVFAPWVYGRDPQPSDHESSALSIEWYDGDRAALRHLFEEAEDSAAQLDAYIDEGRVLVARRGDDVVGHLQLVAADDGDVEVKNMAVVASMRGAGVGRTLVETALSEAAAAGATRAIVATAAADAGNLRFYQRCGFRFLAVERDAFTPDSGYPTPVVIDGIPLRDRVWLDQPLP
jgi:GNAT superfamily N-acetyltransferase